MITINFELPETIFSDLRKNKEETKKEILIAAAVKLYEVGTISQEKGALLAGLSRLEFMKELSRFSVSPYQYSYEDILEEQELLGG